MKKIKFLLRLIHIFYVLAKYGLDKIIVSFSFFSALRFIIYINPWNLFRSKKYSQSEALAKALEELGPVYIKLGQALSTRKDLIPKNYIQSLSRLQDNVQPFSEKIVQQTIKKTFGKPANEVFKTFSEKPLACASMAQVHEATLEDGQDVVVKILRPKIKNKIARDINVMRVIANLIEKYWSESKRLKPHEIVDEFSNTLFDELDLMREAANASQLRRHFNESEILYVPQIYWSYCRHNVLVMERIYGIPISDLDRLKSKKINLKLLAERGIEIFFTQVFNNCFFHADMHPGNIFVNPNKPDSPQYMCVDFGIMGSLTEPDKRYLAENLLAFFNRDYRKVAILHIESGWIPSDTRPDQFESAIRTVCEPIFERPLKDISFGQVILRLFQTGRRFKMEVQPQLILLQKTLLAVEGLGRQIYPELDLWATAKPFLENWLKEQIGFKALLKNTADNIPFFTEQLPYLPKLVFDVCQQQKVINQTQLENKITSNQTKKDFNKGLGLALFALPISAYLLSDLLHIQNLEILGASISIIGAYLLISSKEK